jgi:hypothetical protein
VEETMQKSKRDNRPDRRFSFDRVFTAGFLIGYLPSHSIVRQVQEQTKRLEQRDAILEQSLRITELRGAAGLMRYRVNQNVVPILYGLVSLQTQTLVHIYDRFVWLAL